MTPLAMVPIMEISRPRQWPTISKREFAKSGYPVFGANGRIGFSDQYNHEQPTIIIGCRGSCGEVHVTPPKAYVTGNAMALDELDAARVDMSYIVHFLKNRGFEDVITGSSQPQITRLGLSRIAIPLPTIIEQRRIAAILDKADLLRQRRKQTCDLADSLLRAVFLQKFGDPISNPRKITTAPIKEMGRVVTGNTPPRNDLSNYGPGIEWIKSDNINTPSHFLTKAEESLSKKGELIARVAPANSTLITCIAGSPNSIGNAALADRAVAFNQQINAIIPNARTDPFFLYCQVLVGKRLIQNASTNSMKGMVSKGKFQEIIFLNPPGESQREFGRLFAQTLSANDKLRLSLKESESFLGSLSRRAFSGEL